MNTRIVVSVAAALVCTACQLPDQSKVPPTLRLTYSSGNVSANGGPPNTFHVDPNQPIVIDADAWSSLSGLKSLELDPDASATCTSGNLGQQIDPFYAPIIKTAPQNPLTLHLSAEMNLSSPQSNCQRGWSVNWSGSFKLKATSWNGLSTTSPTLTLISP